MKLDSLALSLAKKIQKEAIKNERIRGMTKVKHSPSATYA
jgi:hypothetical protein